MVAASFAPLLFALTLRRSISDEDAETLRRASTNKLWRPASSQTAASVKKAAGETETGGAAVVRRGAAPGWVVRLATAAGYGLVVVWAIMVCTPSTPSDVPFAMPGSRAGAAKLAVASLEAFPSAQAEATRSAAAVAAGGYSLAGVVRGGPGTQHEFVWATSGQEVYTALINDGFLDTTKWHFRLAEFNFGDGSGNAEEWRVQHNPITGEVETQHHLPEAAPGANLTVQEARTISEEHLRNRGIGVAGVRGGLGDDAAKDVKTTAGPCTSAWEISSSADKLENRTDWTFKYSCGKASGLVQGDLRVGTTVTQPAGPAGLGTARPYVASFTKYVKPPEPWLRAKRNTDTMLQIASLLRSVVIVGALLASAGMGIWAWSQNAVGFAPTLFWRVYSILITLQVAATANNWPLVRYSLSTSSPFGNQLISQAASQLVSVLVRNSFVALAFTYAGSALPWRSQQAQLEGSRRQSGLWTGVSLAALATLVMLVAGELLGMASPDSVTVLPATFDLYGSDLLSGNSAVAKLVLSSLSTVVLQSTVALIFLSRLDNVVMAKASGNGGASADPVGTVVAMLFAGRGTVTVCLGGLLLALTPEPGSRILNEPWFVAVAAVVYTVALVRCLPFAFCWPTAYCSILG